MFPVGRTLSGEIEPIQLPIQKGPFDDVPAELILHIFSFLEIEDLVSARRVNVQWKELAAKQFPLVGVLRDNVFGSKDCVAHFGRIDGTIPRLSIADVALLHKPDPGEPGKRYVDNWFWVLHPESIDSIHFTIKRMRDTASAKNIVLDGSTSIEDEEGHLDIDESLSGKETHWTLMRREDPCSSYMTYEMQAAHVKKSFSDCRFPTIREAVFFHYASLAKGWNLPYQRKIRCEGTFNHFHTLSSVLVGTERKLDGIRTLAIENAFAYMESNLYLAGAVKPHIPLIDADAKSAKNIEM